MKKKDKEKVVSFANKNKIRTFPRNKTKNNFYPSEHFSYERDMSMRIPANASPNNIIELEVTKKKLYAPEFYNLENGISLFKTKVHNANKQNLLRKLLEKYPASKKRIVNAYENSRLFKNKVHNANKQNLEGKLLLYKNFLYYPSVYYPSDAKQWNARIMSTT
jgi:hypothetical protein